MGPGCNTREIGDRLVDLKSELDDLEKKEHELDRQRVWVQQSLRNVTEDSHNMPYPYDAHTCRRMHISLEAKFAVSQLPDWHTVSYFLLIL